MMAVAAQEAKTGDKRAPAAEGRPRRSEAPARKKQKTTASTGTTPPASTAFASPSAQHSPPAAALPSSVSEKKAVRLPAKVADSRPLPSLLEPQSPSLSPDQYQSIASSAVLAASLERSRLRWVHDGVLERYWVKPESGKNAKPAPPNNPDVKCMKIRGECRIRIEPHLFVADMYVEERPKSHPAPKQAVPQYRSPQPYTPPTNRTDAALPPLAQTSQQLLPAQTASRPPVPISRAHHAPSPVQGSAQGQKPSDPVISMLATRASSDPELKTLMKEVATGNATQEQLKVFQRHIDELTVIIQKQKSGQDILSNNRPQQHDGPNGSKAVGTEALAQHQIPPRLSYAGAQQPAPLYGQQKSWPPAAPAPTKLPVILAFKDPGATEDRFLFPENSILEALSPQHLLVSFMITRPGHEATDMAALDSSQEYWQPMTIMIEVAYGREELLNCIRRWVKPADDVSKHMQDVMRRCVRAPDSFLAIQLPFKSSAVTESENVSHEATPVVEDRAKPKSAARSTKKTASAPVKSAAATTKAHSESLAHQALSNSALVSQSHTPSAPGEASEANNGEGDGANLSDARPKRATRKSVRITS